MRWGQPSERTQLILVSPLIVLLSPAIAFSGLLICALIYGTKAKRWLMGPSAQWRNWFAWFPVRPGRWPDEGRWIWLERVERRVTGSGSSEQVEIREPSV